MKLTDLHLPASPACQAALDVATAYCSPALLNHSVRSYLWGAWHAVSHDVAFDAELLYVAAMFHDLALVKEFDNHSLPFEVAGGHLAWVFGAAAGWSTARRKRAAEVIERHMWEQVDRETDAEGYLLELATGIDSSGRQTEDLPPELRADVLTAYPRLGFVAEVVCHFREQAARKPDCLAAKFVRSGFVSRAEGNPLDR
jgi:hypothetical protein